MNIIKRLRRKFIILATIGVIVVLGVALGLINTIAYMRMQSQVMSVLTYIVHNDGAVPQKIGGSDSSFFGDSRFFSDPSWTEETPEFAYQIRFFSVLVDANGYAKDIDIQHIASFSKQEAIEYARTTVEEARENGTRQGVFKKNRASYAYLIKPNDDGSYLIAILDCTRDVAAVSSFMRYSIWFGLACVVFYVLILAALCNVAIQPFVRNMENQKRFITNAGHELKTPIAIISANAEAIEMLNGKSQWTDSILKQVRRLTNLIQDLIMLSKMGERSQVDLVITDVDFSATVHSVVDSFRQLAADGEKKLTAEIADGIKVKGDSKCLYELVNILVDNAVKYCDDKGTIAVALRKPRLGKGAVVTVTNDYADGTNVDYSRFFERFYRGDTSHNSQKAGYGIGLSMAEELTKLMKGKINVSYKEGRITFTVRLN
ncbi:cell wall metabolism sensor histidine kinase WalK [uncultured Megasphaera sp.]|uniref:sensor histidine kinase n=1 Tax=uncultured Megasphaera sp. TaxID=165188 RepID=UPI0025F0E525|nr:HAMP domain-containing sensor histidine kinase [uncultured Megasphaera sp.]